MADIFDMADTWNDGGTTFDAIKMDVTDTASDAASRLINLLVGGASKFAVTKDGQVQAMAGSAAAPAISFLATPTHGLFVGNNNPIIARGGAAVAAFSAAGMQLGADGALLWDSASDPDGSGSDLVLARDGANILAQRNGANAQALRVYKTYTDASNHERGVLQWNSNVLEFGSENGGTGSARNVRIKAAGSNGVYLNTNGQDRWFVSGSGHFQPTADNVFDIGASAGNRPRTGYFSTSVVAPYLAVTDGIAAPGAGTGVARIYVDTADGDLKVVFSDGTVKTIVTDT